MTNQQHPITPSPELVEQWRNLPEYTNQLRMMSTITITTEKLQNIATQAARWGSDQELEACCKLLELSDPNAREFLYAARRPKPPSLKEQALEALDEEHADMRIQNYKLIRSVLESLPS